MIKKYFALFVAAALAASCASSPNSITPQYVSPMMYQGYTCDQIRLELQRIGARVSEVTGQQQRAANNDALAMGVGLVIFWPALFFLASDNDKREELSRLRGEYDALQQAANLKSCGTPQATQPAMSTGPSATPSQFSPNAVSPASVSEIVGVWEGTYTDDQGTRPMAPITFGANGQFVTSTGLSGEWSQSGGTITWRYDQSSAASGHSNVGTITDGVLVATAYRPDETIRGTLRATRVPTPAGN